MTTFTLTIAAARAAVAAAKAARGWEDSDCRHITCSSPRAARQAARCGGRFLHPVTGEWNCYGCRLALKHARWDLLDALRAERDAG